MKDEMPFNTLPSGTVTFLFTDIESSTELLKQLGDEYAIVLADHRQILREIFTRWNGHEVDTQGDSFFVSFPRATQAVAAAVEIQRSLAEQTWPEGVEVRIRMGLHTGEPLAAEEGYVGMDVHRAARIGSIGHGGQVLLSATTAELARGELAEGVGILDLGKYHLKDMPSPERIYQLEIGGLNSEFPPLKAPEAGLPPHNLSAQPTPFVGRHQELKALDEMIVDPSNRLISIVAPGGMGKTRLAIASAEQQISIKERANGKLQYRFPDGVFFVPLAPLEMTEAIIPAIAEATGFQFYGGVEPKQQILDFFRRKQLLLLMDNFEHLKEGASLLTEILGAAPEVKVLVTTREKLNLRSEVIYPLAGMRFPGGEEVEVKLVDKSFSAVELFLQCARRLRPDFVPNEEEVKSIGEICRLVDGMPLGVELAASWMEMLTPSEIASEIHESLDFLEVEMHDVPDRHQSMRAVFDYTWKLLDEGERAVLSSISVFRGGFTKDAARQVTGASLRKLQKLIGKSLVQQRSDGRFDIHELLRQYAAEKMDPDTKDEIRNKHCEYYADYLQEHGEEIAGGQLSRALREIDNIRTSLRWGIANRRFDAVRKSIRGFVMTFHFQGWYLEGRTIFEEAIETLKPSGEVENEICTHGMVLLGLGWFQVWTGDYERGVANLREGRSIVREFGNELEIALGNDGLYAADQSLSTSERRKLLEENLAISEEIKDSAVRNFALTHLGSVALDNREWDKAEHFLKVAIRFSKESNHPRFLGECFRYLGDIAYQHRDYSMAQQYYGESLSYARLMDYKWSVFFTLKRLSSLALVREEYEQAKDFVERARSIANHTGNRANEAESIRMLGVISQEMGIFDGAEEHFEIALSIFKEIGEQLSIGVVTCDLGNIALARKEHRRAREHYQAAIEIGLELEEGLWEWVFTHCVASTAFVQAQVGETTSAIELASLASTHPKLDSLYMKHKLGKLLQDLENEVSSKDFTQAKERGQGRDLVATAQEMLTFLESEKLGDRFDS